jgi:hypothetical protein
MRTVPALAALSLLACADTAVVVGSLEDVAQLKAIPNRELDLLFVVDNSASMADQQAALAANFPRMIDALSQLDGGMPELHIGVVTTDMGTSSLAAPTGSGALGALGAGGCAGAGDDGALVQGASVTDRFIRDVGGVRNFTGELRDVFREIALVGDGGCGFEQPLSAMRRALVNPLNAGFLRPTANLAVVFLADEDDCSALSPDLFGPDSPQLGALHSFRCFRFGVECDQDTSTVGDKTHCRPRAASPYVEDIAPFVDLLTTLKPDPRMVMVSGIVGSPAPVSVGLFPPPGGGPELPTIRPSCTTSTPSGEGAAEPAVRLDAFVSAFAPRGTLTSICDGDLASPLAEIARTTKRLMNDPCLDTTNLADADARVPGVQPSCEVLDIRDAAPDQALLLPACSDGAGDCFELVTDATACPATDDHLRVTIRRTSPVTEDTWSHVRCQPAP